jgi:hypothetical protein
MFTIYPSDTLTVSSHPPNLVSVSFDEDDDSNTIIKFSWSDGAYEGYPEGGVKIGIPADDTQLNRVDVDGGMFVQILDGFVYLTDLNVSGSSTLWATFGQLNSASNTINSFQAIVPYMGQKKGVLFLQGCISLKNWS